MKIEICDERTDGKSLKVSENIWTGRRSVTYDGIAFERVNNKKFVAKISDGEEATITVRGNRLIGTLVESELWNHPIQLSRRLAWWEYMLAILVVVSGFAGAMLGGVVGGAIIGAVLGLLGYVTIELLLHIRQRWLRIVIGVEMVLATGFLGYFLSLAIIAIFA